MTLSKKCDLIPPAPRRGSTGRRAAGAAHVAVILLGSPAAFAQPAQGDMAAAEALFKSARALVAAGDYAAGCPKFEASLALHQSASTMINIARCHEREGKTATALGDYQRAVLLNRDTNGAERREALQNIATTAIEALRARVPKLRIVVASPPAKVALMRDGKDFPASALGEAVPADPGQHQVSVSAPGYRTETRSVTLEEGKTSTVTISLSKSHSVASESDSAAARSAGPGDEQGGVPSWVWVAGGGGLVLTGGAAFFLADDLSAISALRANCKEDAAGTRCVRGYDVEADNARKNRGFGLFVGLGSAGALALGAAVYGLIKASPSKTPAQAVAWTAASPWIAPRSAGALLSGRF